MYDLEKIKRIPCEEIAFEKGIQLKERGDRFWGKIRNEKTSSFSISKNNNLWYDFGSNEGGSVIELTEVLYGFNKKEAVNFLAQKIGLKIKKTIPKKNRCGISLLTDDEMDFLEIKKDRAILNMPLNLNKHSFKDLKNWERHFGIPVEVLFYKYPEIYVNIFNYKTSLKVEPLLKDIKEIEKVLEHYYLGEKDEQVLKMELYKYKNILINLLIFLDKIYPEHKYKNITI